MKEKQKVDFILITEEHPRFDGEAIQITGFLYHTPEGISILAGEPNLRSCCIGSKNRKADQIMISQSDLPNVNNKVITLSGYLYSEQPVGYRLEQVQTIDGGISYPVATLLLSFLTLSSLAILWVRRYKRHIM